jgi:hypothetical protein
MSGNNGEKKWEDRRLCGECEALSHKTGFCRLTGNCRDKEDREEQSENTKCKFMAKPKKKPIPKFDEKWLHCYLHVALKMIGKLTDQEAQICIKQEALDSFPEIEKPIFVYDKSKGHWAAINPKAETKPKNPKLALPNRGLILPP